MDTDQRAATYTQKFKFLHCLQLFCFKLCSLNLVSMAESGDPNVIIAMPSEDEKWNFFFFLPS